MRVQYLKSKIAKFVCCISIIVTVLLLSLFMFKLFSKRYTMDFEVEVNNSQQLTVRLHGREYDDRLSSYYGIDKIDIFNKGKKIQTIVLSEEIPETDRDTLLNGHTESPVKDGCFEAVDVNFDRAQDFSLRAEGYAGSNIGYYYFIWNEEKQQYEYAFFLVRSGDIKIEYERIKVEVQAGSGIPHELTYGYDKDGNLQEIRCIEREVWKEKYIKSFVYNRVDGEMVFERSEIEISIDNGKELSKEEYNEVSKWLADNMVKNADFMNRMYFYIPHKKISFDDKEFYWVEVRWGEVDEAGEVNDTSNIVELIFTCDFTEQYQACRSQYDKLVIYDYGEKGENEVINEDYYAR